ncbi:MAG: hypothetical protein A2846_01265 [Candidatus Doudnabacteria bacterium RIFCSPHIGHO2_01_FULL_49_9]|uniref:POTRA domain-containing protein n=1 Tax=Candidatus Doudnabacteria bacterium RIFCSPHIGHO2_01_FULL_49_9 TaxID=1817827 RepID=A0A1F5NYY6_9BACT|nr:MAG: hypothetical protein A2846_01265 [Candidatus Doudnabacteria bacterium RIFCSPHIGHO2_01_FULL_49_9]
MKIISKGKVLNSAEFYKKKQRRRRIKLALLFIGLISLLSLLIYLSRYEQFLIAEVRVPGEEVIDKDKIVSRVESLLSGYYLWIIPRANALFYPKHTIEDSLLVEFPRFKSVDLSLSEIQTLIVTVEEREPFALYCVGTPECFFVDEEGLIFALAPSFSGAVYFIYTTESPIESPLGQKFLSVEEFKKLSRFMDTLEILDIYPVSLKVGDDEYSLSLPNLPAGRQGGGEIMWRKDSNLDLVYSNLEAFLSDDSIRVQENFLEKILYLDLRTDNKVFYKFKD